MTTYTIEVKCPRCGKLSTVGASEPKPRVSCGDCLMDHVEVVQMEIVRSVANDDDGVDTSDIPEADEAFFKSAKLKRGSNEGD